MNYQSSVYVVSTGTDGPIMAYLDEQLAEQYADMFGGQVCKVSLRVRMSNET